MLSEEKIKKYRAMSPEERWKEVEELMTFAWHTLREMPEGERKKRLDAIRQEHDKSNEALLEHLRRVS